jgi:hypothetical protein
VSVCKCVLPPGVNPIAVNISIFLFFDRVPKMNSNPFVPRTALIIVTCVLYHSRISWSWRDIKTYITRSDRSSVNRVIRYSFARVFCICICACVVKTVRSTVLRVLKITDTWVVWWWSTLHLIRSALKSGVIKHSCPEFYDSTEMYVHYRAFIYLWCAY